MTGGSPHKESVTRKWFLLDDVMFLSYMSVFTKSHQGKFHQGNNHSCVPAGGFTRVLVSTGKGTANRRCRLQQGLQRTAEQN